MAKRLIVNADGFGFGKGATQGIFDAISEGRFITSVSVNANFPEAERISELSNKYPNISIGVHLNPMVGKPCLPPEHVRSLIDENGLFLNNHFPGKLKSGKINLAELEMELDAQIQKMKSLIGDKITHLDGQANRHLQYFDLFLKIAKKWNIPRIRNNASLICMEAISPKRSRIFTYLKMPHIWIIHRYRRIQMNRARKQGLRMADALLTVGYAGMGNKTNPENWKRILNNLPKGTFEIYCHPAYPDKTLHKWATYTNDRADELEILKQPWLRELALRKNIQLISFQKI